MSESYVQFWELIFNFLIAIKWPLSILIIILIVKRSFKQLKENVVKETVVKIIDDKNKKDNIK